jgi:hypothetical protein
MVEISDPRDFIKVEWQARHPDDPVLAQEHCYFTNTHPNRTLRVSISFSANENFQCKQAFSDVRRDFFPHQFEIRLPPKHRRFVGSRIFPRRTLHRNGFPFETVMINMVEEYGAIFAGFEPEPPPTSRDAANALVVYTIPVEGYPGTEALDMIVNIDHRFIIAGKISNAGGPFNSFSLRPLRQLSADHANWRIKDLVASDLGSAAHTEVITVEPPDSES